MSLKERVKSAWSLIDEGSAAAAVDEYFTPDFVRHSGRHDSTLAEFVDILAELHRGFPDLQTEIVDIIEEGDRVAFRWVSEGTHEGVYLGALPTHRRVRATGMTISRLVDGRIAEDWATWNEVSVLHDLGILPIDRS